MNKVDHTVDSVPYVTYGYPTAMLRIPPSRRMMQPFAVVIRHHQRRFLRPYPAVFLRRSGRPLHLRRP